MIDLNVVKRIAKALLDLPLQETKINFVVTHPFTNNPVTAIKEENEIKMLDLRNPEDFKVWQEKIKIEIDKAKNTSDILLLMNKPYWLFFLSLSYEYISEKELGEVLGGFWSQVENISVDANVTSKDLVKMFGRADKETLMESDELERYNKLPDTITLYRGVTGYNSAMKQAMSWTDDMNQALWFMNRFNSTGKELWTIEAPKEAVIACFNGEREYIVDLKKVKTKMKVEKH